MRTALERSQVTMLGLNTSVGNAAAGDFGLGAVPGRESEFQQAVDQALSYGSEIGASTVHCMAGTVAADDFEAAERTFIANLRTAADKAALAGVTLLLEPINHRDKPGYFLSRIEQAASIIGQVGRANVKIMFDCYHTQIMQGDLTKRFETHRELIGHVQIAAVPSRAEPDEGEINYASLCHAVEQLGYDGWIGAEYKPRGRTRGRTGLALTLVWQQHFIKVKRGQSMELGRIADDLTGATDLALMLAREGMRTVQTIGVPSADLDLSSADVVVVALKSRSIPVKDAIAQSLAAAAALKKAGAEHFFFEYCSTFDSTDEGNIGPVAAALLEFAGSSFTLACPAFPANGRTVYKGHLFVNGVPLHESSMRDHPLTPMRDPKSRAGAATADEAVGWPRNLRGCRGGAGCHQGCLQAGASRRASGRDRRCFDRHSPAIHRPGRGGISAYHRRLRCCHGPARGLSRQQCIFLLIQKGIRRSRRT